MTERATSWRRQQRTSVWGRRILLAVCVLGLTLPIAWTILASFEIKPDTNRWPPLLALPPSAGSYVEVMTAVPGFPRVFATSVVVALTATVLTIGTAFLGAYGLARWPFRGKRFVVQGFLVLASLPAMAYVIPLSDLTRLLRLRDTFAGVALASAAVYAPLAVYILSGYLEQVPRSLEDVAHLEGASILQIVWRVILPAAAPGLAATSVLVFVLEWNLFLVPTALTLSHIKTIPVALSDFYTYERELEWSSDAAALTLSLLPVGVLVVLAHRILERFSLSPVSGEP